MRPSRDKHLSDRWAVLVEEMTIMKALSRVLNFRHFPKSSPFLFVYIGQVLCLFECNERVERRARRHTCVIWTFRSRDAQAPYQAPIKSLLGVAAPRATLPAIDILKYIFQLLCIFISDFYLFFLSQKKYFFYFITQRDLILII